MLTEDQTAAVAFLLNAATHRDANKVEMIETHISRVFLAGERAFKMKRAVKLPYADFSTADLRLAVCKLEVERNSMTAPGLYLGTRRLTRAPNDQLEFDGPGELVDAVVEMRRFDQSALLDRMALAGELTPKLMTDVARTIIRFHRGAPVSHSGTGTANLGHVLDINRAGFATSSVFTNVEIEAFDGLFRNALARHGSLLDSRERLGKIRRCHGDLHLRNICRFEGEPRLFDCIEFNDQIATVDVLYDLAFLLMDLWYRGLPEFANLVVNRYLDEADDEDGFILLPMLMAIRAAVRSHVAATLAEEGGDNKVKLVAEAKSYFELARLLLVDCPPRLVALGGMSGSGKTTVAEAVAAHIGAPPGARIVESDRVRKSLHGVPAETRLPARAYLPEVSERVYAEMAWRAGLILSQGGSVVADAVFDRPSDRQRIERSATERHLPFVGFWLEADPDLLWQRVSERKGGPSDATIDVLSRQLRRNGASVSWVKLDAARAPARIVADILAFSPHQPG
ncbi:AAA family ATPase [Aminobacter sp. LjRoot7]|uniref:bifunctional aminoglycoside phosphotransferase/ATP-binding protein n=1 Tax=Aminobacter sp. LjRoot7 TaxID=3342335 RepID=UPI003ED12B4A